VGQPKHYSDHTLVGQPAKRADLLKKFTGISSYVHDIDLPNMLHARVVRPPSYTARLVSVETDSLPDGVEVVRDGSFLAVIAAREEQAIAAADALREKCVWDDGLPLPSSMEAVYEDLLKQPGQSALIVNGTPTDHDIPPPEPPSDAAQTLSATYRRPYQMHGSMGPSASVALWEDNQLTVWSHTQGPFNLKATIAQVMGIDAQQVRIIHMEGAGSYGHNGADDVALDAALSARAVPGRAVSLKWTRSDEHGWEPYGAAMVLKMNASLNDDGTIIDWNHDVWSYPHSTRPRPSDDTSGLLAAWHLEAPFAASPASPKLLKMREFGGHRNAEPAYVFSRQRVVRHFVPNSPLRTSSLRSLGAYANVFAIESFMDELALAAGIDPVEFRLRHLTDVRARAVILAAADKAEWQPRNESSRNGHGRGFAYARYKNQQTYAAIVVDVNVDGETDAIQIERAVIAADSGQVVNPDGTSNQLEGGFVQAASWTLFEQVTFDEQGVTSLDWETYPILQFAHAPVIDVVLLNRPEQAFLGVGEATQNPTAAAIANAVFDATGLRLREIPFTPERIRAARNG
jgi:CO/xanthine dehydrogenase Mo-binding subunit